MLAIVSIPGLIAYSDLSHPSTGQKVSFKAAIVDQLSGTYPNASFTDDARSLLVAAGYAVDYYGPDQITVDFFRGLSAKGYGIVLIRAHSTGWIPGHEITIFTSEPYRTDKYVYEQLVDQVNEAKLAVNATYFTITPKFVRDVMQGQFPHSIIIMTGCTGLVNSEMAQAFVSRGAGVYVSWDKSVTPARTDTATIAMLQSLAKRETIREAVNATMKIVGPDIVFGSQLGYYPESQGGLALAIHTTQVPLLISQNVPARSIRGRIPNDNSTH